MPRKRFNVPQHNRNKTRTPVSSHPWRRGYEIPKSQQLSEQQKRELNVKIAR